MSSRVLLGVLLIFAGSLSSLDGRVMTNANDWGNHCCPKCQVFLNALYRTNHKMICQYGRYGNTPYFATLFDTERRIPVFSSFEIQISTGGQRNPTFYNEAQLVHPELSPHIDTRYRIDEQAKAKKPVRQVQQSQATDEDFEGQATYIKGHLNPAAGHYEEHLAATMTYTNVIPQVNNFNNGCWKKVECLIRQFVYDECPGNHHIVVGAVPGWTQLNNRVNIPSMMWSYVKCNNDNSWAAVMIAPNIDNNYVKSNGLLTAMFMRPDQITRFLDTIQNLGQGNPAYLVETIRTRLRDFNQGRTPNRGVHILNKLICRTINGVAGCHCVQSGSGITSRQLERERVNEPPYQAEYESERPNRKREKIEPDDC